MLDSKREHLLDRYQRLFEISKDLTSTLDLEVLLRHIVRAAADLSDAEYASILLYDQAKQELYFEASTKPDQPMMICMSTPLEGSIAGWIIMNRKPLILPNAHQESPVISGVDMLNHPTMRSLLGVPMISKDKVVGALEAFNKHSGNFDAEDQQILANLGAQAALAIENARLFQQSDLIAEMVHELRTPLASLNTATQLLLRPELPEDQRRHVSKMISDEISRLSELTSSFLDLARLESGRAQFHMTIFDFAKLIEDCVELMRARVIEAGLSINLNVQDPLSPLQADEDKIKQVLINLISNAIKYNRPGGSITISAYNEGQSLVLAVSDAGQGIPLESLASLFQRFYRVPGTEKIAAGTGLGLSICKRVVETHHGTISAHSEAGKGTTFIVRLPITPES